MLAPHILALCVFLSVMWGIVLVHDIVDYVRLRDYADPITISRRGRIVGGFRRMLIAVCVFTLPFSFVFRTGSVLLGLGDEVSGQIAFFALLAPNLIGSVYSVLSLWFDD